MPSNHLRGRGCPECNKSHLEKKVELFLKEQNINFIKEKKFNWLKKINYLPLDFYLIDFNIAIECQGIQHYRKTNFGGQISNEKQELLLEIQKNNDNFKKTMCKEHGIDIIYVKYNDKDYKNTILRILNDITHS